MIYFAAKDPKRKTLAKELGEEETTLKECIEKLKVVEANRAVLVAHLREALQEQVQSERVFLYNGETYFFTE